MRLTDAKKNRGQKSPAAVSLIGFELRECFWNIAGYSKDGKKSELTEFCLLVLSSGTRKVWPLARARRGWPLFWALVHRVGGAAAALAVPGKVPKQPWFIRQKYN
jgi:hypothetical protein